MAEATPCIWVLAGTNGAGKSSIGGEFLRRAGGDYFNPDEVARHISSEHPGLSLEEANSRAWAEGVRQLSESIRHRREHFFETTLGGQTITGLLQAALDAGLDVRIWYAGVASPELHIARVAARASKGGHDIPEQDIRRRFVQSRLNLIRLLPRVTELRIYDDSEEADPAAGAIPEPRLVLHWKERKVLGPADLSSTPEWAKPVVAAALKALEPRRASRRPGR